MYRNNKLNLDDRTGRYVTTLLQDQQGSKHLTSWTLSCYSLLFLLFFLDEDDEGGGGAWIRPKRQ